LPANKLSAANARSFLAMQTSIAFTQRATADISSGDHSSLGLKAMGFSGCLYKILPPSTLTEC